MWTEIDDCSQRSLIQTHRHETKNSIGNNYNDMFKVDKCWLLNDIFICLKLIEWLS